ncbi:hypothetical protein [Roseicitreum antarcticum]|uniref:Uncharacterized protein n=1 Tax=Roseicitreum antarcticum TaxID=564137 RepID=A0A1H2VGR0_9RHOB|nr:hypothetical protein [Roseicitreum antarcticum]SDW67458.1 hypothetical protein SAMN04488238_10363 [Roseicitreum antarcticum]
MSHSENDVDKQVKRHKAPLLGFAAILAAVAVLLVWWLGQEIEAPDAPLQTPAEVESSSAAPSSPTPQSGTLSDSQLIEPGETATTVQTPVQQ